MLDDFTHSALMRHYASVTSLPDFVSLVIVCKHFVEHFALRFAARLACLLTKSCAASSRWPLHPLPRHVSFLPLKLPLFCLLWRLQRGCAATTTIGGLFETWSRLLHLLFERWLLFTLQAWQHNSSHFLPRRESGMGPACRRRVEMTRFLTDWYLFSGLLPCLQNITRLRRLLWVALTPRVCSTSPKLRLTLEYIIIGNCLAVATGVIPRVLIRRVCEQLCLALP